MADNINEKLQNVRTMEDIVNLLSILFTNLNNQNEQYYDMFLNPVPMDLELERYDENGDIETVTHPNVAKMRVSAFSGAGSPEGKQAASIGALYIDTVTLGIYYKATGTDSYGWQLIWTTINLVAGRDYLAPDGNGSKLQELNADSIKSGTLPVVRGGTGVNSITGLVKGNGSSPFTAAIVDQDYLAPSSFTGLIMWCPTAVIPDGWLVCDGTLYNISQRPELTRLCIKLGNKYGGNVRVEDGTIISGSTFGVPDIIDRYVKGGLPADVGATGEGHVGAHSHQIEGTTEMDGEHVHDRGNMEIWGQFQTGVNWGLPDCYGAFYPTGGTGQASSGGRNPADGFNVAFYASRTWTGTTGSTPHQHHINMTISDGGTGENEVDHITMVPIIKY